MKFDRAVELVEQGIAAFETGDITEARKLLEETRAELDRQLAWRRLREEPPQSYEQLIEGVEQARTVLAPSGRTELAQLVRVFTWCRDHGIGLAELQIREKVPKYREAAAYLNEILDSEEGDRPESKVQAMRKALACIQGHSNREATRAWARNR